ncbi:MAG: hypothetical protein QOJ31_1952, partial [Gaiellales bacterium]|nr:hypothetical protein [Gaiellales bacterium]
MLVTGASGATVGWNGESIVSSTATGDGWEPAIAADPSAPYVYVAWMQYKGAKVSINIRTSADGGTTFGAAKPICASCTPAEYDIVLATTSSGTLYAVYMQGNNISFTKSTDHGATFTAPLTISGGTWADKPWMATSANGQDIYVGWSTRGNVITVESHNGGTSFTTPQQITNESAIYYYPNGAAVLPNGTAVIVASRYPEKGNATKLTGPVPIVVFKTSDGGSTWTRTVVDTLNTGASFATSSVTTVASDTAGALVLLYSGSTTVGANGKVYVRRSTDSGATWSAAAEMTTSAGGADATSVAAAGKAPGQFAITWMDVRGGGWNVWERESTDGGVTWTADAKVSDATIGAPYKTAAGFGLPYGDYDTLAINSAGKPVA